MIELRSTANRIGTTRFARLACALLVLVGFGADSRAQVVPPVSPEIQSRLAEFQTRIEDTAGTLAKEPRLRRWSSKQRQALVEFVVGNLLFAATHELGHAVVSEFDLPVLGREENAADDFAILTALRVVANEFSERVLVQATMGWFLSARREAQDGDPPNFYDRHELGEQRAYQIVCLMVGSDPARFKALADKTELPEDRRRTCAWDYDTAFRSWARLMAPHRRAADQPKTRVEVIYGDAKGKLNVYAHSLRAIRFLEILADYAADRYVWPAPITMEMRTCGESRARWTAPTRRLHICYEMAQEFADLYRDYGRDWTLPKCRYKCR